MGHTLRRSRTTWREEPLSDLYFLCFIIVYVQFEKLYVSRIFFNHNFKHLIISEENMPRSRSRTGSRSRSRSGARFRSRSRSGSRGGGRRPAHSRSPMSNRQEDLMQLAGKKHLLNLLSNQEKARGKQGRASAQHLPRSVRPQSLYHGEVGKMRSILITDQ